MIILKELTAAARSLKHHAGVPTAIALTFMGFAAGATRDGDWINGGIFGSVVMAIFCWPPVLYTAWEMRNDGKYSTKTTNSNAGGNSN